MQIDDFLKLRPFAYHTTAEGNLERIRRTRAIESTRRLFERAGQGSDPALRDRRARPRELIVDGERVHIRDQWPLHAGNIAFDPGWDLPRFVDYLNGFAFFWPGDPRGPIPSGRNHFQRYADAGEALVVLRVATRALFAHNPGCRLLFSRVNSGSPRMNKGERQPRGEGTFRTADAFAHPPGQVKEIVLEGVAALPTDVEFAAALAGPWQTLQ